jgi:DHA1 family multidrug resistance protein-like MFS transporter
MIIMPIGLLIFVGQPYPPKAHVKGWTVQAHTHWIGPQIGLLLVALGLMLPFNSIQNFLIDAFTPYSAAAIASATGVSCW